MTINDLATPKGALTSKTIIGAITVLVALACQYLGYDVQIETIGATLDQIVAAGGAALAIVGRKTADRPVSLTKLL